MQGNSVIMEMKFRLDNLSSVAESGDDLESKQTDIFYQRGRDFWNAAVYFCLI